MFEDIKNVVAGFQGDITKAENLRSLEEVKIKYLSKKGLLTQLFEKLKEVSKEDKPVLGKELNVAKITIENAISELKEKFEAEQSQNKNFIDLSLPGKEILAGRKHILTQTLDEIKSIFKKLGFTIHEGPELESDYNNFEALNFPAEHPARDMQDTFFINKDYLLRTHTSPVQIRVMQNQQPPLRAIMPGKVYRNEAVSSRSYCLFHQVEGLVVDKDITFAELKGTLVHFAKEYYGSNLKFRFRPSFFPFTEPSAEMDITCYICGGKGCRICKGSGWIEILGCGMVDPNVFKAVNYDPEKYIGYAFGMGIERIALNKFGINDIRLFFDNDVRFLKQF